MVARFGRMFNAGAYPWSVPGRCPGMCIMCGTRHAPQERDYCAPCSLVARLEVARGLRTLEEYLTAHALFGSSED